MNYTLAQLLHPVSIRKVISTIATPLSRFQDFYGLSIGGRFNQDIGGEVFSWDIFDKTRTIATGRAPGTGPAKVTPQKIGQVTARAYRSHEAIKLLYARIFRNRELGRDFSQVDVRGQKYIRSQVGHLGQRFKNSREFMVSRMLRGSGFYIDIQGDDWVPTDTVTPFKVDYKTPASQIGTVGGIFAGNWQTAGASIHSELLALNALSQRLTGYPIEHAWITGSLWGKILKITEVKDLAGSANMPFAQYERVEATSEEGIRDNGFMARLRGIPWITWHVYDGVLNVDGTESTVVEDNKAIFTPNPSDSWCEMYNGSELVLENTHSQPYEAYGFTNWHTHVIDPAAVELKALDNSLPALYLPKAIFNATVAS